MDPLQSVNSCAHAQAERWAAEWADQQVRTRYAGCSMACDCGMRRNGGAHMPGHFRMHAIGSHAATCGRRSAPLQKRSFPEWCSARVCRGRGATGAPCRIALPHNGPAILFPSAPSGLTAQSATHAELSELRRGSVTGWFVPSLESGWQRACPVHAATGRAASAARQQRGIFSRRALPAIAGS